MAAICYRLRRTFRSKLLILAGFVVVINVTTVLIFLISEKSTICSVNNVANSYDLPCLNGPHSDIAVVLRDYEEFENDVVATVANISSANVQVIIVSDKAPYPPLGIQDNRVQKLLLQVPFGQSFNQYRPDCLVGSSKYVFVVPDAVRCVGQCIEQSIDFLEQKARADESVTLAVFPVIHSSNAKSEFRCLRLNVDIKRWTLLYKLLPINTTICDAVDGGDFVILMKTSTLFSFSSPFLRPLNTLLFIQNSLAGHRVAVERNNLVKFVRSKVLFESNLHHGWKHKQLEHDRIKRAYGTLGVKLVKKPEGRDEWYGCRKDTERCFGTVINDVPEYIHAGRWTPPCCLRALRETARYVFHLLDSWNVRYWLEGGTLLGAMRSSDIIPWDYDIDIGIYQDDIVHSKILSFCRDKQEQFFDTEGYVWEKASEGDFYRVQYSQNNRLHVDIFPFFSRNGTMTKKTWFKTHRQDTEFPESFLQPLDKIEFVGVKASAPNNAKEFLELKFGVGVIENPRFPNNVAVS